MNKCIYGYYNNLIDVRLEKNKSNNHKMFRALLFSIRLFTTYELLILVMNYQL